METLKSFNLETKKKLKNRNKKWKYINLFIKILMGILFGLFVFLIYKAYIILSNTNF